MPKIVGEKKIKRLVNAFKKVENRIHDKVLILNATDTINSSFYNKVRVEIGKDYEALRKTTRKWSERAVPTTYDQNVRMQIKQIKNTPIRPPKQNSYRKIINDQLSTASKSALKKDFDATLFIALDGGEKTLNRLVSLTQQVNISEKRLNKIVGEDFVRGRAPQTTTQKLQKQLMAQALDKRYITIINKNGDPMQYTTAYYAEMVSRTKLSETQAISTANTAVAFGSDLIQISSHNTTTKICLEFEGKIYSISGKDPDFPPLVELNPFHPNCLHTSSVVFREVLEDRGIQKYSDFSLGKTEVHPTRKSHIPQSDIKARLQNEKRSLDNLERLSKRQQRKLDGVDRRLSVLE